MSDLEAQILAFVAKKSYQPQKAKALARLLHVSKDRARDFRAALRQLVNQHRLELGRNQTIRAVPPHGTVTGTFRKSASGHGFVRPHPQDGRAGLEILIREPDILDAATGDAVLVRITRKPSRPDRGPIGVIVQVLERATRQFVGTYFERDGEGYVRVDGGVFRHSVYVGDPGAKGARPDDKVVFDMLRFPGPEERGEGVLTEVLGPHGQPGVDTLSIIRSLGLPDAFPADALEEARQAAATFDETDFDGREDLTHEPALTIDPVDARDFDDAVTLAIDPKSKHWQLGVHIADVAHFAPAGGPLDLEARLRGTSVYLPRRVLPMFPEIISNGLASLQQGRVRYVQSVFMDFTPAGQRTEARFARAVIKVRRRMAYAQVSDFFERIDRSTEGASEWEPEIQAALLRMRELALILRKRRLKRGALELNMPEAELEYDDDGRVSGAHFAVHDISHQLIEEFMLAANEAVAEHLSQLGAPFLRRIHPDPDPNKLRAFAEFAGILGYKMDRSEDRFALQRVLHDSADKPEAAAVHYALLRSLKQAVYSPQEEGHYALASPNYCHFTSPIRRYPDLTVHRLLTRWLRTGKVGGDVNEIRTLGEHCSKTERRADLAERELIKVKLLTYLSERVGLELEGVVTGVAEYGFYAQAAQLPVEGLVHVSTLIDDYYHFDESSRSLIGKRAGQRYRLGDKVRVKVARVDLQRRQLDLRVVSPPRRPPAKKTKKRG